MISQGKVNSEFRLSPLDLARLGDQIQIEENDNIYPLDIKRKMNKMKVEAKITEVVGVADVKDYREEFKVAFNLQMYNKGKEVAKELDEAIYLRKPNDYMHESLCE